MANRVLAGLCMLVLGLFIGMPGYPQSVQPYSFATALAANLSVAWLLVSGIHKVGMLIIGEGFAPVGGFACAMWLVIFGMVITSNSPAAPSLTWPQTVVTFLVFFGWPLVDIVGMYDSY